MGRCQLQARALERVIVSAVSLTWHVIKIAACGRSSRCADELITHQTCGGFLGFGFGTQRRLDCGSLFGGSNLVVGDSDCSLFSPRSHVFSTLTCECLAPAFKLINLHFWGREQVAAAIVTDFVFNRQSENWLIDLTGSLSRIGAFVPPSITCCK